jgi:hypothetical protein
LNQDLSGLSLLKHKKILAWKELAMINKALDETGLTCPPTLKSNRDCVSEMTLSFFSLAQLAERVAFRFAIFARLYFNLFYRTMLDGELFLAGLKPGASVLHIGGGAYPYTALFLAQKRYRVYACDCDKTAVAISREIVAKNGLTDQISILHESGCTIDSSGYDAIWVSRTVRPKERIIEQSWASLKNGGIIVYRKLPAWLPLFGKSEVVFNGHQMSMIRKARFGLGAESIVIKKTKSLFEGRKFFLL